MQTWLEQESGEKLANRELDDFLRDGTLLCSIMNKLSPNIIPKFHEHPRLAFRQMENIGFFLKACKDYGLADHELFITVDLFEAGNMKQVLTCLFALRQRATGAKAKK